MQGQLGASGTEGLAYSDFTRPLHGLGEGKGRRIDGERQTRQQEGDREEAAGLFERAKERYRRSQNVQALGAVSIQSGLLNVSDGSSDRGLVEVQLVLDEARQRAEQEEESP